MVGWHHRLNGHEFEQALGVGEGQGGLACCSPWGRKKMDTTERLNKGGGGNNRGSAWYSLDRSAAEGVASALVRMGKRPSSLTL